MVKGSVPRTAALAIARYGACLAVAIVVLSFAARSLGLVDLSSRIFSSFAAAAPAEKDDATGGVAVCFGGGPAVKAWAVKQWGWGQGTAAAPNVMQQAGLSEPALAGRSLHWWAWPVSPVHTVRR